MGTVQLMGLLCALAVLKKDLYGAKCVAREADPTADEI